MNVTDSSVLGQRSETNYLQSSVAVVISLKFIKLFCKVFHPHLHKRPYHRGTCYISFIKAYFGYCRIGIYLATKNSRKADFSVFRVYFISRANKSYSLVSASDRLGVNFTL